MSYFKGKNKEFSFRDLIYKALIFIGTVGVIVYFLPRDGKFNYQFDIDKPWKYGQLMATFDFPIYKADEVVKREQDSILAAFQPYFQLDKSIEKSVLAKLKADYQTHLRGLLPSTDYVRFLERKLSEVYRAGIVINKCDGNNVDKCQLAATQFRNALHLFPAPESGWTPQVLTYSGFYNLGVKEIWDMVYRYMDFVKGNGYFEHRRNEQSKYWMYETINEQLRNSFFQNGQIVSRLAEAEAMVLSGRQTSFVAAKQLLDEYFASLR
jgi:hypothetical protein